jgi:hypothetical protein
MDYTCFFLPRRAPKKLRLNFFFKHFAEQKSREISGRRLGAGREFRNEIFELNISPPDAKPYLPAGIPIFLYPDYHIQGTNFHSTFF